MSRFYYILLGLKLLVTIACSNVSKEIVYSQKIEVSNNVSELDDQIAKLIERTLNTEMLKDFLHLKLKERHPLVLVCEQNFETINFEIKCFGYPVKIVRPSKNIITGSVIELVYVYKQDNKCELLLKYPIEGLWITSWYEQIDDVWLEVKIEIAED